MKRITRPSHITCTVFSLLLCVACATAVAGEPRRCSKFPTLDEAQAHYQTTLDRARVHTSINGIPSPIVITNWTFK